MSSAPSAQDFFNSEQKHLSLMDHSQYMDFAERYADFVVEFEKKGGDLKLVDRWPGNQVEKRFGH